MGVVIRERRIIRRAWAVELEPAMLAVLVDIHIGMGGSGIT